MNVTELARILKVNPQELREILPQAGFDIGQKAIKIDNHTAQRIIKDWPKIIREFEKQKEIENAEKNTEEEVEKEKKKVFVQNFITVRDFSAISNVPINKILTELMKNGVFASINERIDFETAAVIGSDLGLEVILKEGQEEEKDTSNKLFEILNKEEKNKMKLRPPVIVVMGHVDHGKTRLLDAIRRTNVINEEAGGITQHIGAYQVTRHNRIITFIDTPGHEAFTAMRSRGAKVADIAILVVAADDGVKPQTIEAFRIIKATKVPFIVAINKIDKPGADINKTKQELSNKLNITPEDWGGKVVCALISAKEGTGIEDLLDVILLTADIEENSIKANPAAAAAGTIIESHIDKGAGPVATILIQNGTLKIGDQLCFNNNIYGKIKALKNYKEENIVQAEPSVPVQILGLKILPEVGDVLEVGEGKKIRLKQVKSADQVMTAKKLDESENGSDKSKKFNLVVKSDVLGSAEAIEESLEKINTEYVKTKIVNKGLGNITEGDIEKAETSHAQILGFNVKISHQAEDSARNQNIKIHIFNIIYDLIEYVKEEMQKLVEPEFKRVDLGTLKVIAIFRTENDSQIIGGKVLKGNIEQDSIIEVIQNEAVIAKGKLIKLQIGKEDVKLAEKDQECGIQYKGTPVIKEGDILKFYKEDMIIRKI